MGSNFPILKPNEDQKDNSGRTTAYHQIANCALTRHNSPDVKRVLTSKAQVYVWENFLTSEECAQIVELTNSNLQKSTISSGVSDEYHGFRTSKTCMLHEFDEPIIHDVELRMSKALGISLKWSEPNQAQKYAVGQEFKAHTDYFEPGADEYNEFCNVMGQRTWTFMIYLNEGCKGGNTRFRKLDKSFTPKTGRAVIWNSLTVEGDPNPFTIHHGMKVHEGEKFVITKWFRDKGEGPVCLEE